jgi:hypothetical protein
METHNMTVTVTFRTDDVTKWGTGAGANLTPTQVDLNFWNLKEAVEQLQDDLPDAANGIVSFEVIDNQFYVNMTDNSRLGPYDLPVIQWNYRGAWEAAVDYAVNDVISIGNSTYQVLTAHTSNAVFDPSDNDGSGNYYYNLVLQSTLVPGHAVVAGSTPGNITVPGMPASATLNEVISYSGSTITDLTDEFSISASEQINNTTGTDTTGATLIVRWSTTS